MVWPVSCGHIVLIPKVSVTERVGEGVEKYSPPPPRLPFAHATSGHSRKAFVIKSAYDALL